MNSRTEGVIEILIAFVVFGVVVVIVVVVDLRLCWNCTKTQLKISHRPKNHSLCVARSLWAVVFDLLVNT